MIGMLIWKLEHLILMWALAVKVQLKMSDQAERRRAWWTYDYYLSCETAISTSGPLLAVCLLALLQEWVEMGGLSVGILEWMAIRTASLRLHVVNIDSVTVASPLFFFPWSHWRNSRSSGSSKRRIQINLCGICSANKMKEVLGMEICYINCWLFYYGLSFLLVT